jgi:hypothetical protein
MERLDVPEKLWYIYLLSDAGTITAYHISSTYPLSLGVGMTNPEQIAVRSSYGIGVLPAPGIDGVFWAGCDEDAYYFFDASTGAMGQFNCKYLLYDAPLDINVPLLKIKAE